MRAALLIAGAALLGAAAPTQAGLRTDRAKALHVNLVVATGTCSEVFGFTPVLKFGPGDTIGAVQARTEKEMVSKIDAYWLLHGGYDVTPDMDPDDDPAWSGWYRGIAKPIVALMGDKDESLPGEREAAAAAVAASKDPSLYEEAKARYLASAMRPQYAALEACRAGAADPFIGTHYWTGQSSEEKVKKVEQSMSEFFAELVASLRD